VQYWLKADTLRLKPKGETASDQQRKSVAEASGCECRVGTSVAVLEPMAVDGSGCMGT